MARWLNSSAIEYIIQILINQETVNLYNALSIDHKKMHAIFVTTFLLFTREYITRYIYIYDLITADNSALHSVQFCTRIHAKLLYAEKPNTSCISHHKAIWNIVLKAQK